MAIEQDRAWFDERRRDRADRDVRGAARRAERARSAGRALSAAREHAVGLLFVPVIGVPVLLAWSAMAAWGLTVWGPVGVLLPLFSEGGMWAFDFAVALRRRQDPDAPVWHLQLGIAVFAAIGGGLNFTHGMSPGTPHHGLGIGIPMALVSDGGVAAHQLLIAGPRRARAERHRARLERLIARREHAARMAAARHARVMLDVQGGAALVYRAGTARLTRLPLGVPRLAGFRALQPAPGSAVGSGNPVRKETRTEPARDNEKTLTRPVQDYAADAEIVRTEETVRTPEPGQEQTLTEPVRAAESRTGAASEPVREEARTEAPVRARPRPDSPSGGDVDRDTIVAEMVDELRAAVRAGKRWTPDHQRVMNRTGYGRSWSEKAAAAARKTVLETQDPDAADGGEGTAPDAGRPEHTDQTRTDGTRTDIRTGNPDGTRTGETRTDAETRTARTDEETGTDADPHGPAGRTDPGPDAAVARTDDGSRTAELAGAA
jgi:hypothetical protein